jgi:hypothetical protein
MFGRSIRSLLDKGGSAQVEIPGAKVSLSSQLERSREQSSEHPAKELLPASAPGSEVEPRASAAGVSSAERPSDEHMRELEASLKLARDQARMWQFVFLNNYLVFHTHQVLDWLASFGGAVERSLLETAWLAQIPDPQERAAVVNALVTSGLATTEGPGVRVTDMGRDFLAWRGHCLLVGRRISPRHPCRQLVGFLPRHHSREASIRSWRLDARRRAVSGGGLR